MNLYRKINKKDQIMKKIILTVLIVSIVSLLTFSTFMFIYRSFQEKEANNNLLPVIEKIENNLMGLRFHGNINIDEINDYCRIMWGLDREIVSVEEYSIYDLDGIPVYEIIFEWKKHYPNLSDPKHEATQLFGKYKEPGDSKWIYFRSPEVIRQNFRNLLRD